jgi:hypothetical protein
VRIKFYLYGGFVALGGIFMIFVSLMQRNQAAAKKKRMAGNATVGNTPAPVAASPLHPPAQPQPFMVQVPPNTAQSAATRNPQRSWLASMDSEQAAMCAAISSFVGFLVGLSVCLYAAYGYDVHDYFEGCD